MPDRQDLARRIQVRHKGKDHLRFDLTPELCGPARAAALEAGLRSQPGVYRVVIDGTTGKLAVHFDAHLCGIHDVAKALYALLDDLPDETSDAAPAAAVDPIAAAGAALEDGARRLADSARAALDKLRQANAPEGSLQARLQPVIAGALTEKGAINFLNDLVAFYLIKVHWELITRRWIKAPLLHSNAWLSTFYLVFLLIRYRKQGK